MAEEEWGGGVVKRDEGKGREWRDREGDGDG